MKIKIFIFVFILCLTAHNLYAEKIYLKSGEVIDTPILSRDQGSVTIKRGMVYKKYYNDQILKIETDEKEESLEAAADPSASSELAAISPVKMNLIRQFIEITGTKRNLERNFEEIVDNAPAGRYEELKNLMNVEDMIAQLIPVYDHYYSEEDLRQLIAFYQSPLGQKVLDVTPKLTRDVLEKSIRYFKDKSPAQKR